MSTYYCPKCGKGIEDKDFSKAKKFFITMPKVNCPECHNKIKPKFAGFFISIGVPLGVIGGIMQSNSAKDKFPFLSAVFIVTGILFILYYLLISFIQYRKKKKFNLTK